MKREDSGIAAAQTICRRHAQDQRIRMTPLHKPRLQKVEGEEKSPSSPKTKEDEGGSEQASMKDLLEQTTI